MVMIPPYYLPLLLIHHIDCLTFLNGTDVAALIDVDVYLTSEKTKMSTSHSICLREALLQYFVP